MFPSFTGLHRPVKGTKVSTVLSTPGQATIPPSSIDIGMGRHIERFWGCGEEASTAIEASKALVQPRFGERTACHEKTFLPEQSTKSS